MKRRFFLFAAPAIVAAPSLMRVSTMPQSLAQFEITESFSYVPAGVYQRYSGYEVVHLDATDCLSVGGVDRYGRPYWLTTLPATSGLTS